MPPLDKDGNFITDYGVLYYAIKEVDTEPDEGFIKGLELQKEFYRAVVAAELIQKKQPPKFRKLWQVANARYCRKSR